MQSFCPKYEEHDTTNKVSEDSPPSYTEAMRSNMHQDQPVAQSIWTTPIQQKASEIQPQAASTGGLPSTNLLDLDIGALPSAESQISPGSRISSLPANTGLGYKPDDKFPRNSSSSSIKSRTSQIDQNTRTKHVYRNWNPPMLGNLPDDFLRLIPPDTPAWATAAGAGVLAGVGFSELSNISPAGVSEMLDSKPRVHKSHSKSHKVSRSFSEATSDFKTREKDLRSKSEKKSDRAVDKMSKSFSLADDTVSPRSSDKVSRSHSSRHRNWNGHSRDFMDGRSPTHHSVVCI